jgi:hypothetical protein
MNIGGRILWSHLKMPSVTVSVQTAPKPRVYMFRVLNMVEVGAMGRTAIVEPFHPDDGFDMSFMDQKEQSPKLPVPYKVGDLKFMYTGKSPVKLTDLDYVVNCTFGGNTVEKIVMEVLSPGDLLVVRPKRDLGGIKSVEALRVASRFKKHKGVYLHAV